MRTVYECALPIQAAALSLEDRVGQLSVHQAMFRLGRQVTDKERLARPSPWLEHAT